MHNLRRGIFKHRNGVSMLLSSPHCVHQLEVPIPLIITYVHPQGMREEEDDDDEDDDDDDENKK